MLWFNHPKPFNRREVAMQMAERTTEPPPDTHTITVAMRDNDASELLALAGGGSGEPIRFSVSYGLGEYLGFLYDHVRWVRKRGSRATRLWVALIGTPLFLWKRHRMPVCDFTIDDECIMRVSVAGMVCESWDEVASVRTCSRGWLLIFKSGAMPIPYRCLNAAQSSYFRRLLVGRKSAASSANA